MFVTHASFNFQYIFILSFYRKHADTIILITIGKPCIYSFFILGIEFIFAHMRTKFAKVAAPHEMLRGPAVGCLVSKLTNVRQVP
jgi:hypothetical protein